MRSFVAFFSYGYHYAMLPMFTIRYYHAAATIDRPLLISLFLRFEPDAHERACCQRAGACEAARRAALCLRARRAQI